MSGFVVLNRILLSVVLLLVAIAVISYRSATPNVDPALDAAVGKPCPQLDLVLLSSTGELERIPDLAPRTVTLLHCWGTWCGPCRIEYPELAEMALSMEESYAFRFVSISCENRQNETLRGLHAKTQSFLDQHRIVGVAYADPNGVTRRSIAERLGLDNLYYPTTILICPAGNIAAVWVGYDPGAVNEMKDTALALMSH